MSAPQNPSPPEHQIHRGCAAMNLAPIRVGIDQHAAVKASVQRLVVLVKCQRPPRRPKSPPSQSCDGNAPIGIQPLSRPIIAEEYLRRLRARSVVAVAN